MPDLEKQSDKDDFSLQESRKTALKLLPFLYQALNSDRRHNIYEDHFLGKMIDTKKKDEMLPISSYEADAVDALLGLQNIESDLPNHDQLIVTDAKILEKDLLEFKPIQKIHRYKNATINTVRSGNTGFIFESTPNHKWVVKFPETISDKRLKHIRNENGYSLLETSEILNNKSNKLLVVSAVYREGEGTLKNKIYKYGDNWISYLLESSQEQRQSWLFSAIVYDGNQKKTERPTENKTLSNLEWEYDGNHGKQSFGFKQKDIQHRDAFLLSAFLNEGTVTWKKAKNTEILDVLQMIVTANTDIINRVISEVDVSGYNEEYVNNIKTEIDNLRKYANECFVDICKAYSCKTVS